jgi:hypothetical protein
VIAVRRHPTEQFTMMRSLLIGVASFSATATLIVGSVLQGASLFG